MPERTNGKKHTINVNQIVYKELHRPQVEDAGLTFPIYTKVDNYRGNDVDTRAESSKKYQERSKSHFNSANNIRRVYITHNKIYIDYYKSPGLQTLKMPTTTQARLSEDLLDAIPKMVSFESDLSAYQMERNINPKAQGPDEYRIEGNLLGVLNQLYTCNNIEEIYFDWTYLFSSDIQNLLMNKGLGMIVGPNAMAAFLNGQAPCDRLVKTDIWNIWFRETAFNRAEKTALMSDKTRFRSKYPRLKLIAMVSNLGDVIESSVRAHSLMNELRSGGEQAWLTKNAGLINSGNNSVVIMSIIGSIGNINPQFVVQDSTYKFDKDFKEWIKAYTTSAENYIRQTKYGTDSADSKSGGGAQDSSTGDLDMNEVEQRLLAIESEVGADKFKNILMSTVGSGFKVNELKSLFRTFTKPNRLRWAKLVSLPLD